MHKHIKNNGFTLIEVMIAIIILGIALLGLAAVTASVINGNTFSKQVTSATTSAQDKMEEMKNIPYASLASGGDADSIYTRTWTVTSDSPTVGTKTIVVTVSWSWSGSTRNVTLRTIVAQ